MKILILRKEENDRRFLKALEENYLFEPDFRTVRNADDVSAMLNRLNDPEIKVIIVDRIYFKLSLLKNIKDRFDWFFVVESMDRAQDFGEVAFDMRYRFYLWPVNLSLLIDDIKSLSVLRQYMTFGEISLGEIRINLGSRTVFNDNHSIFLKNKEYELLLYLAKNRGKVLSRNNILENVWDMNSQVLTNTVDVHISKLRKKLKTHFGLDSLVKTIPCSGYILL
jgi:DNA-binding response OmpR family regulator